MLVKFTKTFQLTRGRYLDNRVGRGGREWAAGLESRSFGRRSRCRKEARIGVIKFVLRLGQLGGKEKVRSKAGDSNQQPRKKEMFWRRAVVGNLSVQK